MLCEYFLDNNNNFIFKLKIFCSKIYLSSTCFILYSIDLLYNIFFNICYVKLYKRKYFII